MLSSMIMKNWTKYLIRKIRKLGEWLEVVLGSGILTPIRFLLLPLQKSVCIQLQTLFMIENFIVT